MVQGIIISIISMRRYLVAILCPNFSALRTFGIFI